MAESHALNGEAVHRFPIRVYYEDTDAGGIVFYANYLKFAERARTELLREMGAESAAEAKRQGVSFAVRRCEIEYLRPARLDDLLQVETRLLDLGGATLDAEQTVRRDGDMLVRMLIRLACMGPAGRPTRLPTGLRAALQPYCQSQQRE
jgi:acyl-CoA thioester hydrolase